LSRAQNKNKSKKVQQYIQQVQVSSGAKREPNEAELAARRKEKEAQKSAEKEMLALLGADFKLDKKGKPKLKKDEAEKVALKEEEEKAKKDKEDANDFGMPICPLRDVYGQGSKVLVQRVCGELTWKDNLPGKAFDGSPCLYVKVSDGTTLNPMTVCLMGEAPTTFEGKVQMIVDIRGATAMVRGNKVLLEVSKGAQGLKDAQPGIECSFEIASEKLSAFIRERIEEEVAIRERGGIPIEERIEEERAQLKPPLTPVTEASFKVWKEKQVKLKVKAAEEAAKERKGGKQGMLSGKALFLKDRSLFVDDAGALGADEMVIDSDYEEEEPQQERFANDDDDAGGAADDDDAGADGAAAKPPNAPAEAAAAAVQDLYLGGDDGDLDDLDSDEDEE
jgi:hypothetical protein